MKHTPGPWHVLAERGYGVYVYADARKDGDDDVCMVHAHKTDTETLANANLISAGPELLAALRELVICVRGGGSEADLAQALRDADSAIAKATGEA